MKETTLRLLIWLYPSPSDRERAAPVSDLKYLLPDLTPAGRRSLLHLVIKRELVDSVSLADATSLRLTSHGKTALEEAIPAFHHGRQTWQGDWSVIIFLQAPKNDPQFRYLRTQLLAVRAAALTRGVYLFPGSLPAKIQDILDSLYPGAVLVFGLRRWEFGDERSTISKLFTLSDVAQPLSGISKEVDRLLELSESTKESGSQLKQHLFLVFNRLFSIFSDDVGIVKRYFPQVESSLELLGRLQSLAALPET